MKHLIYSTIFADIKSANRRKSRRRRECVICRDRINKGEEYINMLTRYDRRLITYSMHEECLNSKPHKLTWYEKAYVITVVVLAASASIVLILFYLGLIEI